MTYKPRDIRPLRERFWEKVKETECGCWEWTGYKNPNGYGRIGLGRRTDGSANAHRVSWEINMGPIPEGFHVLHTCDNPGCVNPFHLFLGTQAKNLQDCRNKGRAGYGILSGESNGNAKLTESEVLAQERTSFQKKQKNMTKIMTSLAKSGKKVKGPELSDMTPAVARAMGVL